MLHPDPSASRGPYDGCCGATKPVGAGGPGIVVSLINLGLNCLVTFGGLCGSAIRCAIFVPGFVPQMVRVSIIKEEDAHE